MQREPDARGVLGGAARLKAALRPIMAGLAIVFVGVAIWDLKRCGAEKSESRVSLCQSQLAH